MSQTRPPKRGATTKTEGVCAVGHLSEIQSILNTLLHPILQEISILNEAVTSVLSLTRKKENESDFKVNKNCEFASSSITTDVTMMASNVHRLTKNYESMKEQITENQKNMDKFFCKLNNIEKLLTSLLKMLNNRPVKQSEKQILEKVCNIEQALLGGFDMNQHTNTSLISPSPTKQYQVSASVALDSSLQLITLNNEEDFPNGSWLGDSTSPKCRVRCPISEEAVIYINTRCTTPEKMAITLLDYLFTRETLAVSNLSGKSKLGKKQLDPLMIYGIKCHLMHHFNITDKQWERIKQNMDSKCRSAWKKRKLSEMKPLEDDDSTDKKIKSGSEMVERIEQVMVEGVKTQVIHTLQGDIEILHATPDQILRFHDVQNIHNIHVLAGDSILPVMNSDTEDPDSTIPLATIPLDDEKDCEENLTIITTNDSDLNSGDGVSFVTEPMLEVLTEDALNIDSSVLIEEG